MLWDPFLYCINDSIQGNSETGNKVFVLPSKVAINNFTSSITDSYFIIISLFYTFCNFLFANMLVQSQIQKTCHLLLLTNAWQYIKLATDSISCILWYKKCGLAPLFSGTCPHFYFLFRIFTCYILCSPESIFYIQPRMIQVHIHERFPLPLWIQALLSVQDVHYILLLSELFPRY